MSSSAAPVAGKAKQAPAPCNVVTAGLLADTLGTKISEATKGIFEPTTAAGTGCRFTKVGASSSVNILAEVTPDAANYLPELAYTPPAGSSPVHGADRGFVKPPAAGASTSSILLVKGSTGVLITIFQDSPPVTAAGLQKLASTVLARL